MSIPHGIRADPLEGSTFLLGIELRRHEGGDLLLVEQKYALEVVENFGMGDSKPVSTPFEPGSILGVEGCPQNEEERAAMEVIPYRSALSLI